jgi:hypothetical protein
LIDSVDDFSFETNLRERDEFDEKGRREIDDDESDDDDESMKNAKIDRDDDSVNNLNEIDRCDFFRKRNFSDEIHLKNCVLNN